MNIESSRGWHGETVEVKRTGPLTRAETLMWEQFESETGLSYTRWQGLERARGILRTIIEAADQWPSLAEEAQAALDDLDCDGEEFGIALRSAALARMDG